MVLVCSLSLAAALLWAGEADRLFKQARKAEKNGDYLNAYLLYSQARGLNPTRERYLQSAESVRGLASEALAEAGKLETAAALGSTGAYLLQSAQRPLPDIVKPIGQAEMAEVRRLRPPVELEPESKQATFRFKGTLTEAFETVAREFGLDVMFDSDYQGSDTIRFDLTDTDFQQTILALNDVARTFIVPVSPKLFMVAADNQQKRTELEPVVAVMEPIPNSVNPEEVMQIGQAVQQSLEIKRFQIDTTSGQVFMRDTVTRVRMAQALVEHLAKPRAEVMLDVELIAVSDSVMRNLGLGLPSAFPITNFSTIWNNQPTALEAGATLLGIGGGKTVFGLAIGSASLVANQLRSESRLLQRFRVRATHGLPASLHIGERYPIINARFSPILTDDEIQDEIDQGTYQEPFPSFTFEDLGLALDFTPQVHSAREVSLDLSVQFRLLTGSMANDIPIIANREFESMVRVRDGELAVISGMAVAQTFRVRSGVVFVSEIPVLGNLFTRHTREQVANDLLVLVRPHVIRLPPAEVAPSLTLRHGPEGRPLSGI